MISVNQKRYEIKEGDLRLEQALSQNHDIPLEIASILIKRDISCDEAEDFLNPTLKRYLLDPVHLKDFQKAVDRLYEALMHKEKIVIYGDYDVDGATSSAVWKRYLNACGVGCDIFIPRRLEEGYGPNKEALLELKNKGAQVVIFVDCGTTAFDELSYAKEIGLDCLIFDHHAGATTLPEAVSIINPNRLDEDSPLTYLCAAGVSFVFLTGLNRFLRQKGWFEKIPEPNLLSLLDLVALGTVCDVMPLKNLNRAFVKQGLKIMKQRHNIGLRALCDVSGLDSTPSSYHLGFVLGPRVNAGGRVGESHLGSLLLSTNDPSCAQEIAKKLNHYNEERKTIEHQVLEESLNQIFLKNLEKDPVLLVQGNGWHPGVIGIVASRLKEKFKKPACVIAFDEHGIGKGSGRSVTGVHLGMCMHKAVHHKLLLHGGGHEMAAGFTVLKDSFEAFYDFVQQDLKDSLEGYKPIEYLDAVLSLQGLNPNFLEKLSLLEPYGAGHPSPRFLVQNCRVENAFPMGEGHARFELKTLDNFTIKAVSFRLTETPLETVIFSREKKLYDVVVQPKLDTFGGRNAVQVIVEDFIEM